MKKQSLKHFLRNIYGYTLFSNFLVVLPVHSIFMQSYGVSDFELSLLLVVWVLGSVVTQMPIARIASKIGLRSTIVLGQFLLAIGYGMWAIWPNLTCFAIGMFLIGIQGAIHEVIPDTIIYNEISAQHRTSTYERILGYKRNFLLIGNILAMCGSLLIGLGYNVLTIISVVSIAISIIFSLRLKTTAANNVAHVTHSLRVIGAGLKMLRTNKNFMLFVLLNVLVANLAYLNDFLPVIGYQIGIPVKFVGIMSIFIFGCNMLGNAVAHKFKFLSEAMLYCVIMFGGLLFVLFSNMYSVPGLLILGASYLVFGMAKILLYSKMQAAITSKNRLIGLSFHNILSQTFYGITCIILGLGSGAGSWRYGILLLGGLLICVGFVPLLFHQKNKM